MRFVADFHLHSKYSRATSKDMNLENMALFAEKKGILVLGTADFTHPLWFKEIKENLEPVGQGIFSLKNKKSKTLFVLTTEISCIYSKKGKVRKIHLLVFAPSLPFVEKLNARLSWVGNLKADGRPILGLDAKELLKLVLSLSPDAFVVPAHAWTPWFSLFGSRSGFDSIEECFEELSFEIFALESGLSSDPPMNWRLSALDRIAIISNSDSHSLLKMGREANVFDLEKIDFFEIKKAIKEKDNKRFLFTIEFFPEEGKYHFDGHRLCHQRFSPSETKKYQGICPVCKKPLTVGVLHRVEELADRPEGFVPSGAIPFRSLLPLSEIIAQAFGLLENSKKIKEEYEKLIKEFENELNLLLFLPLEKIKGKIDPRIFQGIQKMREGKVEKEPGYDGLYGKIKIVFDQEKNGQKSLF
jgi:uncharacterized protein (TIGR00375 family)